MNALQINPELEAEILKLAQAQQQSPDTFIHGLLNGKQPQHNPQQKLLDEVLYFVAQQGWQYQSSSFLRSLVKFLAEKLELEYAFVDEFADADKTIARTVVFYANGDYADNIIYPLLDTPCAGVLTEGLCTYPGNIQQLFPLDAMLVDAGAESYAGVPLWSSQGERIGLVAVMGRQPFQQPELVNAMLQIVAVRTAHELERIQYENSLRTSEQFMRSILDSITSHIAIVSEDGTIMATNGAWKRFAAENGATGNVSEQANYLKVCDNTVGAEAVTAQRIAAGIRAVLQGQQSEFHLEYPCDTPKKQLWFHCHVTPLQYGTQKQVIVAHENITVFKQTQNELEKYRHNLEVLVEKRTIQLAVTNERLREEIHERHHTESILRTEKLQTELILNNVADAVLLSDTTPAIVYVNPAWEQLTGYKQAEVVGKNPSILHSNHTPKSTYDDLWQTIKAGEVWSGLIFNQRKDGSQYDALSTIVPIVDVAGEIRNYVEVHRDVTEERQLNAMKEAFIANAAHDLGNPVAVLQTSLHLLKRNPAQIEKRVAIIENQVDRLFALVRDLLTVSRLDRKMMLPQLAPLNINTLIATTLDAQQSLADELAQTLIFTPQSELPYTNADAEQIERVIVNLVSNALRYTPAGGSIELTTQQLDDKVVFTVKDNGIGIAPDDIPFVFDRFFRSGNAQATTHGTGLGLAIVKEIVQLHQGKIVADSKLGEGTTFSVYLPTIP
jgi:PAS domain S-box-containing protein